MRTARPSILFSPSPGQADTLVHALLSEDATLITLAARFNTTVEALSLWMTSPAIRDRLYATDSSTCWHIRLRANSHTALVLATLTKILTDFNTTPLAERSASTATAPDPAAAAPASPRTGSLTPALIAARSCETARKAATLVLRLTNHQPAAPPHAPSPHHSAFNFPPATGHRSSHIPAPRIPPPSVSPIEQFATFLSMLSPEDLAQIASMDPAPQTSHAGPAPESVDLPAGVSSAQSASPRATCAAPPQGSGAGATPDTPQRPPVPASPISRPVSHHAIPSLAEVVPEHADEPELVAACSSWP